MLVLEILVLFNGLVIIKLEENIESESIMISSLIVEESESKSEVKFSESVLVIKLSVFIRLKLFLNFKRFSVFF